MKTYISEKDQLTKIKCPKCNSDKHEWKDVYYDSGTLLKKVNEQLIAWCSTSQQFVFTT